MIEQQARQNREMAQRGAPAAGGQGPPQQQAGQAQQVRAVN